MDHELRGGDAIFQSTHPVWGGTAPDPILFDLDRDFNPPTPYGVGLRDVERHLLTMGFQSTHPVWGGTPVSRERVERMTISIHPPRMGWDVANANIDKLKKHFNPPTPYGVGPMPTTLFCTTTAFQSTHPVWGGTETAFGVFLDTLISIHPPRMGWDITANLYYYDTSDFNPPTPYGVGPCGPASDLRFD